MFWGIWAYTPAASAEMMKLLSGCKAENAPLLCASVSPSLLFPWFLGQPRAALDAEPQYTRKGQPRGPLEHSH